MRLHLSVGTFILLFHRLVITLNCYMWLWSNVPYTVLIGMKVKTLVQFHLPFTVLERVPTLFYGDGRNLLSHFNLLAIITIFLMWHLINCKFVCEEFHRSPLMIHAVVGFRLVTNLWICSQIVRTVVSEEISPLCFMKKRSKIISRKHLHDYALSGQCQAQG
jgi:hypothetical protein